MTQFKCDEDIRVKCSKCCHEISVAAEDFNFEPVESHERGMGPEVHHLATWERLCGGCGEEMSFEIDVWENPSGVYETMDVTPYGCTLLDEPRIIIEQIDLSD